MTVPDAGRVAALAARESERYRLAHPRSRAARAQAGEVLLDGVPLHWMDLYSVPFPFFVESAEGNRLTDLDGNSYIDFGLCGTAALWGHRSREIAEELSRSPAAGAVTGWPGTDSVQAAQSLRTLFGLPLWQFTISATDANRLAVKIAKLATGRQRILVFNGSYHGGIDEFNVALVDGEAVSADPAGAGRPARATALAEFNDLPAVERALASGEVAAVLTEPALTNGGGIVLPDPGFHDRLRALCRATGTLLIVDETQSVVLGPGGATAAWSLDPDLLVLGKSFAFGHPVGAVGMREGVARVFHDVTHPTGGIDLAGVGSTLAASQLAMRLARRCLESAVTADAYRAMDATAARLEEGWSRVIGEARLPWTVARLGAMVTCSFLDAAPRNGSELRGPANDPALRDALFLFLAGRGFLVGCFGGAAVTCPDTTAEDVDGLVAAFEEAVRAIVPD